MTGQMEGHLEQALQTELAPGASSRNRYPTHGPTGGTKEETDMISEE